MLLRSDGEVAAFGWNIAGQTKVPFLPPPLTFTAVAAGGAHTVPPAATTMATQNRR